MTILLAMLLKLQFSLTTTASLFFMVTFQKINAEFENEGLQPQLEIQELEQELPEEKVKPAEDPRK